MYLQSISDAEIWQHRAAAFALYPAATNLAEIATRLEQDGISPKDVCVLLPEDHPTSEVVRRLSSGSDENPQVRATLAWLSKFGAVVIRGLGSFLSARQFVSALLPAKDGQDASATVLQGLGVSPGEAQRYAASIATGGIFVFVRCQSEKQARHASELLLNTGAQEARYVAERLTEMPLALRKAG